MPSLTDRKWGEQGLIGSDRESRLRLLVLCQEPTHPPQNIFSLNLGIRSLPETAN